MLEKIAYALKINILNLLEGTTSETENLLKYYRIKKNVTLQELSEKTEIHVSSLEKYENGEILIPSSKIKKIGEALNIMEWVYPLISFPATYGDLITNARGKKKMSPQKLAEGIGISKDELLLMEENAIKPTKRIINDMAAFMKIDKRELIDLSTVLKYVNFNILGIYNSLDKKRKQKLLDYAYLLLDEMEHDKS